MTFTESEPAAPIQLGRTAPFSLGALQIEPATRQVVSGTRRETVEPRVMQVLVALARARGEVVSREDLIATCWGGVVVGDNAIHRVISRLREVAAAFGEDSFRIETIARVGYRLEPAAAAPAAPEEETPEPEPQPEPAPEPPPPPWSRVRPGLAAGLALAVAVGAGAAVSILSAQKRAPAPSSVAVEAGGGEVAARLARGLEAELPGGFGGRPLQVRAAEPGAAAKPADYRVRILAEASGSATRADLRVVSREGDLIWSESFEFPADSAAELREAAASRLASVLDCAEQARADRQQLDAASLRMFIGACQRLPGAPDASALSLLRTVTARYPDAAPAIAWQAFAEAKLASMHEGDPAEAAERDALRAAAAAHLKRARELGARTGIVVLAQATMLPRPRWREKLSLVQRGIASDPDFAPLHRLKADLLQACGRMADGIDSARRAVDLAPLDPYGRVGLIFTLAYGGHVEAAKAELARDERIWPGAPMAEARNNLDLRFGDPGAYIRRIDDGSLTVNDGYEFLSGSTRSYLVARARPTAENVEAAMRDVQAQARSSPGNPWPMQAYAALGRVDAAYVMMDEPGALQRLSFGPEVLFRPYVRPLRLDPRFMRLTARLGLVAYWRETGRWPDFCLDKALPYDCRSEAAKAEREVRAGV